MTQNLTYVLAQTLRFVIDVGVVSFVIYRILVWAKGTRVEQLLKGILILVAVAFISDWLNLITINWILSQLGIVIAVAIPVVFQPELRRLLEQLGRGGLFNRFLRSVPEETSYLIDELTRCALTLARGKTGALIAIEREDKLNDYIETGVLLDSLVTSELLINIFAPATPLHDGAVIIRNNRIVAAGCFLPLSDNPYLSRQLGTRHRAALGLSEVTDAVVVVVSEETGAISVVEKGNLTRYLEEISLKDLLTELLAGDDDKNNSFAGKKRGS